MLILAHVIGAVVACIIVVAYVFLSAGIWKPDGEKYNLAMFASSLLLFVVVLIEPQGLTMGLTAGLFSVALVNLYRCYSSNGGLEVFDWVSRLRPK